MVQEVMDIHFEVSGLFDAPPEQIYDARLDSSIVIRTVVAQKSTLYFSVGGAVVYDSRPEREYEETLEKAQSIMKAI